MVIDITITDAPLRGASVIVMVLGVLSLFYLEIIFLGIFSENTQS